MLSILSINPIRSTESYQKVAISVHKRREKFTLSKSKTMGQVFTPSHIAQFILDNIGYTAREEILDKTIYEPSFGQGVFLFEIIDRIVARAAKDNIPSSVVSGVLNTNVHGVELDKDLYKETIENLNTHVLSHEITPPKWTNLICGDALGHNPDRKFDYIVGNPPYIRTHNLTTEMRANMERFAITATGTSDMYVTFMEYGLSVLKPGGKLSYIVPNSWLKNTSQKEFREYLFNQRLLKSVHDFMGEKVFSTIGTYTAVVVLCADNTHLDYSQKESGNWVTSSIPFENLMNGDTWLFQSPFNQNILKTNRARKRTLGDICIIQNALMTMRNSIYVNAAAAGVEDEILYDAVKASTFKGGPTQERILFPYKVNDGSVSPYTEHEMKTLFPNTYDYLLDNKDELLARKSEASAAWFHYGRSQGIALLPTKRKIVFRQYFPDSLTKMDVHILPESTLVYGGWFIMEKQGSGYSLEDIKEIMESEEFCTIMRLTGKDKSGGYKELYSKHVKSFGIN